VSDGERSQSLVEQAAGWVPPWVRDAARDPDGNAVPAAEPDGNAVPAAEPDGAGADVQDGVPGPDGAEAAGAAEALAQAELRSALEAVLLVADEPVGEMTLAQVLDQPTERVTEALAELSAEYDSAGRGFELRRAAGGWRLYTHPDQAAYVERFVLDGQRARLTQAALETLAVVAYRQPVTRGRVSAIRGVNCDGVIRTLLTRGLVEECGTESDTGAHLYRTTGLFLEKLGLDSVDQLPPLAPFVPDDVAMLDLAAGGGDHIAAGGGGDHIVPGGGHDQP
jgi:segregation and condensation protein B